jgi:hypothetical protein
VFELRRKQQNGELPKLLDSFTDPFFERHAKAVGEVAFKNSYPDGTARQTGLITIWRGAEGITVKVFDSEVSESWQYTAETFEKALKRLETALQAGESGNRSPKSRPQFKGRK